MRNTGQVYACDNNSARLARLKPRLQRAGLSNVQPFAIDSEADPEVVGLKLQKRMQCLSIHPVAVLAHFDATPI
jgi:16S rRNA C967 or C1407 C5-methylase (RsmB/RsmF family)